MTGWKIFNMLKTCFNYKDDESFFNSYNSYDKFKEPDLNVDNAKTHLRNISNAEKEVSSSLHDIDLIDSDEYKHEVSSIKSSLDNALSEISSTESVIDDLIKSTIELDAWGNDWKDIALALFEVMLEKYPDDIESLGFLRNNINSNVIKSAKGIDKFKL